MATRLIRQQKLHDDTWQVAAAPASVVPGSDLLLTLAQWRSEPEAWLAAGQARLGVRLEPNDDPAIIAADLQHFALIAVVFPSFTDGRGYSIARLLRERHGYLGELRAIGDVSRDQLHYLARVGFDAFLLREGESAEQSLASFGSFSEAYQSAVDQPSPLFRRRLA